jgi:hypothetical protein
MPGTSALFKTVFKTLNRNLSKFFFTWLEFWKQPEVSWIQVRKHSGWSMAKMTFPAKNCNTQSEECSGALSWWRINEWSLHIFPCLHLMTSINLFSTYM